MGLDTSVQKQCKNCGENIEIEGWGGISILNDFLTDTQKPQEEEVGYNCFTLNEKVLDELELYLRRRLMRGDLDEDGEKQAWYYIDFANRMRYQLFSNSLRIEMGW